MRIIMKILMETKFLALLVLTFNMLIVRISSYDPDTCIQCRKSHMCNQPDCFCCRDEMPIFNQKIPQMVFFTFDDAVNPQVSSFYRELFDPSRINPNGCPIKMTLFISHSNTVYSLVRDFYQKGMEIASHSVTHSNPDPRTFLNEAKNQKENLAKKARIPESEIKGWRSPFLKPLGDQQPEILKQLGYEYDATLTLIKGNSQDKAAIPFTLDYGWPYDCKIQPCPKKEHKGFWEVPVVSVKDYLDKYDCVYIDGCNIPPPSEALAYKFLWDNFENYYKTNRAPMGINMHASWFYYPDRKKAMSRFIQDILKLGDVYIVTVSQVIAWLRDPTPLSGIKEFVPWRCDAKNISISQPPKVYDLRAKSLQERQRENVLLAKNDLHALKQKAIATEKSKSAIQSSGPIPVRQGLVNIRPTKAPNGQNVLNIRQLPTGAPQRALSPAQYLRGLQNALVIRPAQSPVRQSVINMRPQQMHMNEGPLPAQVPIFPWTRQQFLQQPQRTQPPPPLNPNYPLVRFWWRQPDAPLPNRSPNVHIVRPQQRQSLYPQQNMMQQNMRHFQIMERQRQLARQQVLGRGRQQGAVGANQENILRQQHLQKIQELRRQKELLQQQELENQRLAEIKRQDALKKKQEEEMQRKLLRQKELEKQRLAEMKRNQELKRQKELETQRLAEIKRNQELKRQKELENRRLAEIKRNEELKRQKELEKQRLAEMKRNQELKRQKELEKQRLAEIKRNQELERIRIANLKQEELKRRQNNPIMQSSTNEIHQNLVEKKTLPQNQQSEAQTIQHMKQLAERNFRKLQELERQQNSVVHATLAPRLKPRLSGRSMWQMDTSDLRQLNAPWENWMIGQSLMDGVSSDFLNFGLSEFNAVPVKKSKKPKAGTMISFKPQTVFSVSNDRGPNSFSVRSSKNYAKSTYSDVSEQPNENVLSMKKGIARQKKTGVVEQKRKHVVKQKTTDAATTTQRPKETTPADKVIVVQALSQSPISTKPRPKETPPADKVIVVQIQPQSPKSTTQSSVKVKQLSQQTQKKQTAEILISHGTISSPEKMIKPDAQIGKSDYTQESKKKQWRKSVVIVRKPSETDLVTNQKIIPTANLIKYCKDSTCKTPNCLCKSVSPPNGLLPENTPQIVYITVDGSVDFHLYSNIQKIFSKHRMNPNGCPIKGTLFTVDANSNYLLTKMLHSKDFEIAMKGLTTSAYSSANSLKRDINQQKQKLFKNANVPAADIKGWRSPELKPLGDKQFEILRNLSLYDSTLISDKNPPNDKKLFPFTLDYGWKERCEINTCPAKNHPGIWEVPIIPVSGPNNTRSCEYIDSCANQPDGEQETIDFLMDNFNQYYKGNRAPFAIRLHQVWFHWYYTKNLSGLMKFLDNILKLGDVYVVTVANMLEWMKDPTSLEKIKNFKPWSCAVS